MLRNGTQSCKKCWNLLKNLQTVQRKIVEPLMSAMHLLATKKVTMRLMTKRQESKSNKKSKHTRIVRVETSGLLLAVWKRLSCQRMMGIHQSLKIERLPNGQRDQESDQLWTQRKPQ